MERYKIADEKIVSGYDYLERGNSQKACDMWLEAWDDIKSIMSSIGSTILINYSKNINGQSFYPIMCRILKRNYITQGLKTRNTFARGLSIARKC
jgi:hypothetical protein